MTFHIEKKWNICRNPLCDAFFSIKKVKTGQEKNISKVYSENTVGERGTQELFARFRSENFDVKDAPLSHWKVNDIL